MWSSSSPSSREERRRRRPRRRRRRRAATDAEDAPPPPFAPPRAGRSSNKKTGVLAVSATTALSLSAAACIPSASAHGYLKTPRSRNLVAYQDKNWATYLGGNGSSNDPEPEDCPHCLNRGGSLAQCGILYGLSGNEPIERNYDRPLNSRRLPMPLNIQGTYQEGDAIEVVVLVTTHHRGHFEFAVCPIEDATPMPTPTEECFASNKLAFVSDEMYGAPRDPNYPERAYIAPASVASWTNGAPGEQPVVGAEYRMKFRLPRGVAGDLVLLQWYYLTANSCKHPGYDEYPFPESWGKDVDSYPRLPDCENIPEDGDGVPEQFWNCAEIEVIESEESSTGQHDTSNFLNDVTITRPTRPDGYTSGTASITRPTRPGGYASDIAADVSQSVPVVADKEQVPDQLPTPMTNMPTKNPTTLRPAERPTPHPVHRTQRPTGRPTLRPSRRPTNEPTPRPTRRPTKQPRSRPTRRPTKEPTPWPTRRPTKEPRPRPTRHPTKQPQPTVQLSKPSAHSFFLNNKPTKRPQRQRTPRPTSFTMLPPSESYIVPVNNPSKGQEATLGDKIGNQIMQANKPKREKLQDQKRKEKKQKQKKRQRKKKQREKKRQKKNQMKEKRSN